MGKKYIIELLDDCQSEFKGIMVFGLTQEKQISVELIPEESLRPYTEPDLEQVRKEAYEDGFKNAVHNCPEGCPYVEQEKKLRMDEAYQKGLNDLWEAMQKAIKMYCEIDNEVYLRVFYDVKCDWGESVLQALFKNTPQHLIDSIRKYEQKQEEQIQVGDEVTTDSGKAVVTGVGPVHFEYVNADGSHGYDEVKNVKKTGRHFPEIAAVLEKMREES